MKLILLLITLIACSIMIPADMYAQLRSSPTSDSLKTNLELLQSSPFPDPKIEQNLLKMDHFGLKSFSEPWTKRFALEIGKSVLDDNYGNFFGDQFRPLSASDFNYSVNYYRRTGDIPFRRTSTAELFRFN